MKKICALVLTTAMLLSFAACGKKDQSNVSSQDTTATQQADDNGGETTKAPSADALVLLPGKLVIVNEGDNVPVIKGINVSGNRAGTTERLLKNFRKELKVIIVRLFLIAYRAMH